MYYKQKNRGMSIKDMYIDSLTDGHFVIPEGVTEVNSWEFPNSEKIKEITIPDSVKFIGWNVFSETTWLKNQPDGVVYAGKVAYGWNGEMPEGTKITLREDTVGIADGAFGDMQNLTEITLPEGLEVIGNMAFIDCENLADFNFPDSLIYLDSLSLTGTPWYKKQPDGVIYAGKVAYAYKGMFPRNAHVEIRDGTKAITSGLFIDGEKSHRLRKVTIPESVTHIGLCLFEDIMYDIKKNITIRCRSGSFANEYALDNKLKIELY